MLFAAVALRQGSRRSEGLICPSHSQQHKSLTRGLHVGKKENISASLSRCPLSNIRHNCQESNSQQSNELVLSPKYIFVVVNTFMEMQQMKKKWRNCISIILWRSLASQIPHEVPRLVHVRHYCDTSLVMHEPRHSQTNIVVSSVSSWCHRSQDDSTGSGRQRVFQRDTWEQNQVQTAAPPPPTDEDAPLWNALLRRSCVCVQLSGRQRAGRVLCGVLHHLISRGVSLMR